MKSSKTMTGGPWKQQNFSDNKMTVLGAMKMRNALAKVGTEARTIGRIHLGVTPSKRTIPRLCRRGIETQSCLMTMSLMFSFVKEVRTRVIIVFLFLD